MQLFTRWEKAQQGIACEGTPADKRTGSDLCASVAFREIAASERGKRAEGAVSAGALKDGADGGTRTRTPFEKQIFVPLRLSPPPDRRSWSGLSLRQGLPTVGASRLVSTPSPEGLGSGLV